MTSTQDAAGDVLREAIGKHVVELHGPHSASGVSVLTWRLASALPAKVIGSDIGSLV